MNTNTLGMLYNVDNGRIFRFESAKILQDLVNQINNKNWINIIFW
jgi:hypothetical protein